MSAKSLSDNNPISKATVALVINNEKAYSGLVSISSSDFELISLSVIPFRSEKKINIFLKAFETMSSTINLAIFIFFSPPMALGGLSDALLPLPLTDGKKGGRPYSPLYVSYSPWV
jgi:hypothetical protein